jgi:hypothetical protein
LDRIKSVTQIDKRKKLGGQQDDSPVEVTDGQTVVLKTGKKTSS